MLNIILGCKNFEKYLKGKRYKDNNDGIFNTEYERDWFNDTFVQRVLSTVDNIDISESKGTAFTNRITGDTHSQRELSTGCKTVILIYKFPEIVFQARFGDNCTDFIEEIASKHDITIKADYLHSFNFKYIKEINYINYNFVARSKADLLDLLFRFRQDNGDNFDDSDNSYYNNKPKKLIEGTFLYELEHNNDNN